MSGDQFGPTYGFAVPPMPSAPPPAPADPLRAVAVALLNLSGLGLGYVLVRRWILAAVCWAATVVLLFVALPADPDGVSGGALTAYVVFLVLAAAHGAVVGLRTRLMWPAAAPVAILLGLVLLAVPAGGVVLYDGARDEATEEMLLDRLERADRLVSKAEGKPFGSARSDLKDAWREYGDLRDDHPDSRAAERVPDRMKSYYSTVGAPYAQKKYCDAIPPLQYLRTLSRGTDKKDLGSLATWPDDRLATSLYECGSDGLAAGDAVWPTHFGELLGTFPESEQAAKVEPAVGSAVDKAVKDVRGDEPCAAVDRLKALSSQVEGLKGEEAGVEQALAKEVGRADKSAGSGAYDCGVDQYKDGDFADALSTMNDFVDDNKGSKNRERAKKIAIAAEIAQTVPAAGKRLPTTASGGGITVTLKNDSPDDITVLFTGPVTGSVTLKGCGSCTAYSTSSTLSLGFKPCSDSGKKYPQRTISLPVGTTYFLHKPKSGTSGTTPASDTAKLSSGYIYTECAYTTKGFGLGT
ncbi:hypothetical protein ACIPJS_04145 [Streptomyces sp. NPDC086783]|uniref:hypothetical protein n=1 Tax=Streptomyces sp. NPDC086783 TaxID=3365758 RepID=UPI00381AC091